jgi:uncharacterized protein (TIGR03435 family)
MVGLLTAPLGRAQSPNRQQAAVATAPLAFDVVSVKPTTVGPGEMLIRPMPGGQTYIARNVPLRLMIKAMYRITDSQIVGGADWIDTEHYDIDAKVDRPSTVDQLHEMFRTLLADRFQLQFHRETRLASAYVMTGVKSGAKLKLSEGHEQFDVPIKPDGAGRMVGTRVPMSYLAWFLSQQLDAPVVNDTRLDGYYDFTAWLSPERSAGLLVVADSSGERRQTWTEGVIVALREQLGLTLQQRKAPVEVFVIDHAARPEAN